MTAERVSLGVYRASYRVATKVPLQTISIYFPLGGTEIKIDHCPAVSPRDRFSVLSSAFLRPLSSSCCYRDASRLLATR